MSETAKPEQTAVNALGTKSSSDTPVTRGRSGPVRYQLVDKDGNVYPGRYSSAVQAAIAAERIWPGQEQDDDRTGKGWDIQVEGCE